MLVLKNVRINGPLKLTYTIVKDESLVKTPPDIRGSRRSTKVFICDSSYGLGTGVSPTT